MGKIPKTTPEESKQQQKNIDRLRELARRGLEELERTATGQAANEPPKS